MMIESPEIHISKYNKDFHFVFVLHKVSKTGNSLSDSI